MSEHQQPKEYIIDLTSLNPKDPIDERWADSFARSQSENIILNYRGKKIKMIISDASRPHPAPATEAQQRIDAAIKELERLVAFCDKRGFYHQRLKYEKVIALLQAGEP